MFEIIALSVVIFAAVFCVLFVMGEVLNPFIDIVGALCIVGLLVLFTYGVETACPNVAIYVYCGAGF